MQRNDDTRTRILKAALKVFANNGYSGGSIQEIVRTARITKPALYYYFGSKEGLHSALVEWAQDSRYEVMQKATEKHTTFKEQLIDLIDSLLDFATEQSEFTRVCFATAFAAPGEVPNQQVCFKKSQRNFEFVHKLIENGIASGELDSKYDTEELTLAIYSQTALYAISQIVHAKRASRRPNARRMVEMFYEGAQAKRKAKAI